MVKVESLILCMLILLVSTSQLRAQDESLELTDSSDPTTDVGPTQSTTVTFLYNEDNTSGTTYSTYLPQTNITFSLSNQEYPSGSTQNTDPIDATEPAGVIGWTFNEQGGGTEFIRDGSATEINSLMSNLSQSIPASTNFSSLEGTPGAGINAGNGTEGTGTNSAIFMSVSFEPLRGEVYGGENGARYEMVDLTITFNEPVTDPVLHFIGLGGVWERTTGGTQYINTATMEFELDSFSASSGSLTFSKLSGTSDFEVVDGTKLIRNSAPVPDFEVTNVGGTDLTGVGTGSVLIDGNGIESLTFSLYARSMTDDGRDAANAETASGGTEWGNTDWGWAGNGTSDFPNINFSADLFMIGVSAPVQSDNQTLTLADCFRMLSAPVEGTTYGDLVGNFWIQGQNITGDGVDYTDGSTDPNVFIWPTDGSTGSFSGWDELSNLDATIAPGTGFLISVFEDDDYEASGVQGGFDKTISVTGSENEPPTVSGSDDTMSDGSNEFSLLGNPFKSTIDWNNIHPTNTLDVRNAVYIWDRSIPGYRSYVGDVAGAGGYGDLTGGLIEPFQGFLVQNEETIDAGGPEVDFAGAKAAADGSGAFYGKSDTRQNFVRLEVNGEALFNSMWVWFSDKGSLEGTTGDALELTPLSYDYAMMGTRKTDGTIFDIGHYPIPAEDFEIPLSLETTRSGTFTITATDMDLSFGSDLYLIDLQENESIRIDENLNYQFTLEGASAKGKGDELRKCTVGTPQKAKTVASTDRFVLTTQPKEFGSEIPESVALEQNYPNPFNPTTQISYELPQQANVRLEVYDLVGRQVATLVNETMEAGTHTVNFNATNLSSGVYIYRLNTGNAVLSRKLTVIK